MEQFANNRSQLTAAQFASKFKSKREVYTFLTIDAGAYLPSHEAVTIYYLKDLISGKKKYLRQNKLKHLYIPQYEGLEFESILKFLKDYEEVFQYLPMHKEILKLPKQFLVNLSYSLLGDQFANWVKDRINQRNQKLAVERNLMIDMDPEIARAFQNSTSISMNKGMGVNMLKVESKRRRTKAEVDRDKAQALHKQSLIESGLQQINQLQQAVQNANSQAAQNQGAADILNELISQGVIVQEGDGSISVPAAGFNIKDQQQQQRFNI